MGVEFDRVLQRDRHLKDFGKNSDRLQRAVVAHRRIGFQNGRVSRPAHGGDAVLCAVVLHDDLRLQRGLSKLRQAARPARQSGRAASQRRRADVLALLRLPLLFAFGMLTLVVADNLLLMFVGWEIMGLCSYLLIGFWYARNYDDPKKITPRGAAVKAFITTRVGDVVMLLGIAYLYFMTTTEEARHILGKAAGTLSFRDILYNAKFLEYLAEQPSVIVGLSVAALIGIFLFIGTVGKSAQFPLHVWLPDAMEGPTPVSAMIHAAAMVSAGVYAVIRMYPLMAAGWEEGHALTPPMLAMGAIGAFTALFASTIAVTQRDVKKFSPIRPSHNLGFMIAALGIGAYVAAAFHLMTHAFFKALLFLGSGSVIHGVEHGAHHSNEHLDPQDMFNMGGLRKKMPITFWTFLIGGFALAGFPFITAGFWSKDEILADAWANNQIVFYVLVISATLTAFYTMRQIALTFFGEPRTHSAEHASENVWTMTYPLIFLAIFALFSWLCRCAERTCRVGLQQLSASFVSATLVEKPHHPEFTIVPMIFSIVAALGGLGLGWLVYGMKPLKAGQKDPLAVLGPIYTLLENKYYFDELYEFIFGRPARWIASVLVYQIMDRTIIDGALTLIARFAYFVGHVFKVTEKYTINDPPDWGWRRPFNGWVAPSA